VLQLDGENRIIPTSPLSQSVIRQNVGPDLIFTEAQVVLLSSSRGSSSGGKSTTTET
jgi:hypothetical protein